MIRAAGILIISKDGKALFLKRGPGGDAPGLWCVPGGRLEDGETPLQAAVRETEEETGGFKADAKSLKAWSRTVSPRETTGAPATPPGASVPVAVDPANGATVLAGEDVEFTTFVLNGVDQFMPDVAKSGEHVAFAWAPLADPPQSLHPGVAASLGKFGMHELDIAREIAAGRFASPQRYENLWLFALRITGTGMAYRRAHDEYVWRDGSLYLTQEFLDRCAGLPVIWEHPEGNVLNTKEYRDRTIGAVMFAYIRPDPEGRGNDEVWAIARVNDGEAAEEMDKGSSTSPAVVWRDIGVNTEIQIEGKDFLIEGKPSLLDHIAICPAGVWDKGRTPSGVSTSSVRGDSNDMSKEELEALLKSEAQKRADENAARDKTLAALTETLKSVGDSMAQLKARKDAEDEKDRADAMKRRDTFKFGKRGDEDDDKWKERRDADEKAYCDACMEAGDSEEDAKKKAADARKDADEEDKKEVEREKADKARKDAAEEEEKKKAADRADADRVGNLEKELAALRGQVKPMTDADLNAMARVQARADSIEMSFGRRARAPMLGETVMGYSRFWANELKQHDARYADKDLTAVAADESMFGVVLEDIFKSAEAAAKSPARGKPGTLTPVKTRSDSGHTIIEYHGSTSPWMNQFAGPVRQFAKRFRDRDDKRA